ncbi:IQ calmodulin-binding motif-containing protein [Legionella sp. CNM-1927-20]|uniref:IQ calmodulin-binding motif-containing protein n=1 Tax=Legionella sp. CNM-1927-20 TaxID=3422221 RepID=UPI00403B325A
MHSKKEIQAANKIQAFFRGFLARKAYHIKQIPAQDLENYTVMIKGNDPAIDNLPQHEANEGVALIVVSGMRSIEIACQLSKGSPKLIIIDNSQQVVEFWRKAREVMQESLNQTDFLNELREYVMSTRCNRSRLTASEFEYLEKIFHTFGFNQIKQIISNVTVLGQSWADEYIMVKVKNILAHHDIKNIYVYPSNIVAYLDEDIEGEKILNNIARLNPAMAIHTNFVGGKPRAYFLITDHTPDKVKPLLISNENSIIAQPR